jgi:hypothetical protein
VITAQEQMILSLTADAWGLWLELPDKHPDDLDEFRYAVHQIQMLVAYRVARRAAPEVFGSPATEEGEI